MLGEVSELVERLRKAPDDAEVWQVLGDRLMDELPMPTETVLDELEAWARAMAADSRRDWHDEDLPALTLVPDAGGVAVVQWTSREPGAYRGFERIRWSTAAFGERDVQASTTRTLEAYASTVWDSLRGRNAEVEIMVTQGHVEAVQWREVVPTVTDPDREISEAEAQATDPTNAVGDLLGMLFSFETVLARWALLCALRGARPVGIEAAPSAEDELAAALMAEVAQGVDRVEFLRFLHETWRVRVPGRGTFPVIWESSDGLSLVHVVRAVSEAGASMPDDPVESFEDLLRMGRVPDETIGAALVAVEPGTRVGFARGPVTPAVAGEALVRALERWRLHLWYFYSKPTTLASLMPMRDDLIVAFANAIQRQHPLVAPVTLQGEARELDDQRAYETLVAQAPEEQERTMRSLLQTCARQMREVDAMFAEALDALLDDDDLLLRRSVDPDDPFIEGFMLHTSVFMMALVLADRVAERRGIPLPSAHFTQDRPGISFVSPHLAALGAPD